MHIADKLAEMRTKFHVIQAKLIMSVWCFTVHWCHLGDELCCQQFLVSNILLLADQFIQKILPNWQAGRLAPAPAQPRSCIWNKKLSNYETKRQCRGHRTL